MRFEFDSISELSDFIDFAARLGGTFSAQREPAAAAVPAFLTTHVPEQLVETVCKVAGDTPETVEDPSNTPSVEFTEPPTEPKRKRRTKAEMEAARAAEAGNAPAGEVQADSASTTSTESVTEAVGAGNPFAQQALPAADKQAVETAAAEALQANEPKDPPAATEVGEFITARLTERPEVNQLEHLNLARTFIGKHGMDKYNQSFAMAGLSNNVMGYSPADCARHAAALDFLSLE